MVLVIVEILGETPEKRTGLMIVRPRKRLPASFNGHELPEII